MNRVEVTVRRKATFSVGQGVRYYGKPAIVRDVTPHYILIECDGHKSRIDWLQLYATHGLLFSVDIDITKL